MKVAGFQPNFTRPTDKAESILEKLASGKKVNSAKDDAAGLAIINRLSAELDAYKVGTQNSYDGVSLAQTAEGAYSGISDATNRIKELTVQAGNGTLSAGDRQAIQGEIEQLTGHIGDIASDTTFGGVGLLDNAGSIGIQTGGSGSVDIATNDVNADLNGFGLNTIDITTQAGRAAAETTLNSVSDYTNTARADLGATQNRLDSTIRNNENQRINLAESRSRRADADFAQLTADRARENILQQSGNAIQGQANLNRQQALNLLG
jgi:flagellin